MSLMNLWMRIKSKWFVASAGAVLILGIQGCELNSRLPVDDSPPGVMAAATAPCLAVQLCWSGEQVNLTPPIDAERTVFRSQEFRRWQFGGATEDFSYVDDQGRKYEVKTSGLTTGEIRAGSANKGGGKEGSEKKPQVRSFGKKSKKKENNRDNSLERGQSKVSDAGSASHSPSAAKVKEPTVTRPTLKLIVSRYRPDGTLENETTFRPDGSVDNWTTYAADGKSCLVKVQMRPRVAPSKGAPLIQFVNFYEDDRIRQVAVNERNVAWSEVVINESGMIRSRLHEDPSKADKIHPAE